MRLASARYAVIFASTLGSILISLGQSVQPQFEGVSIRRSKPGEVRTLLRAFPGGRVVAANAPIKLLIEWAFVVRDYQVTGEPGWADRDGFDVETSSNGNPRYDLAQPVLQTMFQTVLRERFGLSFHHLMKEMPIYALQLTDKQRPALTPGSCVEPPVADTPCPSIRITKYAQIVGSNVSMSNLAKALTAFAGRTVVDQTGISGGYDFTLDWTQFLRPFPSPAGDARANSFDPASVQPAISSALRSQLGMTLQSNKGPIDVLVIDHVEPPSQN
jgi:bla regulator protein blaR1